MLAAFESKRLFNSLFIISVIVSIPLLTTRTAQRLPLLSTLSGYAGLQALPLTIVAFLGTYGAALRHRRYRSEDLQAAIPSSKGSHVLAHALALVPVAAASSVITIATLWALKPSIGSIELGEIISASLGVLASGSLALATAYLTRAWLWGPAYLTGVALVQVFFTFEGFTSGSLRENDLRWFALWPSVEGYVPLSFLARPTGTHIAFLALLSAGFLLLAFIRSEPGLKLHAGFMALILLGSGIAVGASQAGRVEHLGEQVARLLVASDGHSCIRESQIDICTYPGYEEMRDLWLPVLEGVKDGMPPAARTEMLVVSQRPKLRDLQDATLDRLPERLLTRDSMGLVTWVADEEVHPDFSWEAGGRRGISELGLALDASVTLVGLPTGPTLAPVKGLKDRQGQPVTATQLTSCRTVGQARGVIALWLAAQSTQRASAAFVELLADAPIDQTRDRSPSDSLRRTRLHGLRGLSGEIPNISWMNEEASLALKMLEVPRHQVIDRLGREWKRWIRPETETMELIRHLGIEGQGGRDDVTRSGVDPTTHQASSQRSTASRGVRCS